MKASQRWLILSATAVTLAGSAFGFAPSNPIPTTGTPAPGVQVVEKLDSLGNTWAYLLYLPYQYDAQPTRKWPVLVHYGTLGACNDYGPFANVYDDRSPYTITNGGVANYLRTPDNAHFVSDSFIVLVPWMSFQQLTACNTNTTAVNAAYEAYFGPLFAHVFGKYRVDPKRIHAEGFCFGGTVLYKHACLHPTYFASVFYWATANAGHDQACADLTKACTVKDIATQTIYGSGDTFIGNDIEKAFSDAIIACSGSKVTASIIQGAGHEAWWYGADTTHAIYSYRLSNVAAVGYGGAVAVSKPVQSLNGVVASAIHSNDLVEVIGLNGQVVSRCKAADVRSMKNGGVRLIRTLGANQQIAKVYLQDATR